MSARWSTFGLWALVAGSALFWALQLFVTAPAAPPGTVAVQPGAGARGDLARLFGTDAPAPVAAAAVEPVPDNRFQLVGVLSPRSAQASREGLALIAVDGGPAKAFRVGASVVEGTVLQSVRARGVTLGPRGGEATSTLELTPPPVAATGTLPSALQGGNAGTQPPRNVGGPAPPPGNTPPGNAPAEMTQPQ